MNQVALLMETYLMVLVHPFRIHEQFRHRLPLAGQDGHVYQPLTLAEAIGISWIFSILRGLFKILILLFMLKSFLSMESGDFPFLADLLENSKSRAYYFLLFSAALDIIFFPITTLVLTELWAWVIRLYATWLNPELPGETIADQVTTHALSSNLFYIVPFIGDVIQHFLYYFLLYAGLRSNLGASRSLAWVILLTPFVLGIMLVSFVAFIAFYLMS